jgi:hypothetical protein
MMPPNEDFNNTATKTRNQSCVLRFLKHVLAAAQLNEE